MTERTKKFGGTPERPPRRRSDLVAAFEGDLAPPEPSAEERPAPSDQADESGYAPDPGTGETE